MYQKGDLSNRTVTVSPVILSENVELCSLEIYVDYPREILQLETFGERRKISLLIFPHVKAKIVFLNMLKKIFLSLKFIINK